MRQRPARIIILALLILGVPVIALAQAPTSVTLSSTLVTGGTPVTGEVRLTGPAPAGGLAVQLSSSNTAVASFQQPFVTVTASATMASFVIKTSAVADQRTVSITATAGGVMKAAQLSVHPPAVSSLTLPNSVTGGTDARGELFLNGPPPAGGLNIGISSSRPDVAEYRNASLQPVSIGAGNYKYKFTIKTSPVLAPTIVRITAGTNYGSKTADLSVVAVAPSSVVLAPITVTGGRASSGTVVLTGPAPQGGFGIALASSNTAVATVPPSVTVPQGATHTSFTVTTAPVGKSTHADVVASLGGVTKTARLNVVAPILASFSLSPGSIAGGQHSTGQVTLSGPAPAGGLAIQLLSSNAAAATVPASVTVPTGQSTSSLTVMARLVTQPTPVTIAATVGEVTKRAPLTVAPPLLSSVTLPASITAGTSSTGRVGLSGPAPAGGLAVQLSSSNTNLATVQPSVTVPAGATTAGFTVLARPIVAQPAPVTITATAGGVSESAQVTVTR